jgi:hypothetical protein
MHGQHQWRGHRREQFFRRPFPNRQELLERLESYQRDVEQELADLQDVIQHLRGGAPQQGGEQPQSY